MTNQFEILDEYPTLTDNELAEITGGRDVCEGGGWGGPIVGVYFGRPDWW